MKTTVAAGDWRREALAVAEHCRLPFGRKAWPGSQGNWGGAGVGSSIDFQDHRAYLPGDDPRYIHWAAYARTGQLTMKLYRAESAPLVDIMVDASESMSLTPEKAARTDGLLAFCLASAERAAAPVRIHAVNGRSFRPVPTDAVRAGSWRDHVTAAGGAVPPGALPWRMGAMKVWITDLLFPGDPAPLLESMAASRGLGIVLVPAMATERRLEERGNLEVVDCESGGRRHQYVDEGLAERYALAYRRHFELWSEAARRRGILLAILPTEGSLRDALLRDALPKGAVELDT